MRAFNVEGKQRAGAVERTREDPRDLLGEVRVLGGGSSRSRTLYSRSKAESSIQLGIVEPDPVLP